uniref:LysM and putative peptidoglycan-binding domain-containing protein 1 n=1 Tax=Neogobius melanostomus TaxID=47308 RepID=A0A8C6SWK1_9GOBI
WYLYIDQRVGEEHGRLLRIALPACSRTRSYGSLVRAPLSPVHHRRVEHTLQPGETLQGLALKYGVTMEQIKRANRLYTNESIFLKKSLSIPVMADPNASAEEEGGPNQETEQAQDDSRDIADLTPGDFLRRLDGLINQSKHAAEKRCLAAEKSSRTTFKRSQSVILPPSHQTTLVTVPHTITKLTRKLKEREDEIFEL